MQELHLSAWRAHAAPVRLSAPVDLCATAHRRFVQEAQAKGLLVECMGRVGTQIARKVAQA